MGEYFKPLRRKLGAVTLLVACLFAVGWVRSCGRYDEMYFVFKDRTLFLYSGGQRFYIRHNVTSGGVVFIGNVAMGTIRAHVPDPEVAEASGMNVTWHAKSATAKNLRLYNEPDLFPDWESNEIELIPYWSIVIPLTLLSAWLLLWKGREPKPTELAV